MSNLMNVAGSFRDPAGHVFDYKGRILRTVSPSASANYVHIRDKGLFQELADEGLIVVTRELAASEWPEELHSSAHVLEHDRIPYISYAYEWSFSQLKEAALHHLDLQLRLLENDVVLSDSTAYNIQFVGSRPIFIDVLSLRPYTEGEFWGGHRQFCEQFLNPLLLRAILGVPHNAWFRGTLEGIKTSELARLIPLSKRWSWGIFTQVMLQAKLEHQSLQAPGKAIERAGASRGLSRNGYKGILGQLRRWIARLTPADTGKTVWGDYAQDNTYSDGEASAKRAFISGFVESVKPNHLVDLGCNTGNYSVAALEAGANYVVGFDFDQRAIDLAFSRSREQKLNYLPLWLDAANPSPDQGWRQQERTGFSSRTKMDAVIALAFEHHLAIGRNIPLPQLIDWLIAIAPVGVVEFVPKEDVTVQRMLALREDIFTDYSAENFENLLRQKSAIRSQKKISQSGRTLFIYDRS